MEKKFIITAGIAFLVIILIISLLYTALTDALEEDEQSYEKYVGEEVIVEDDTLTIVDYSIFTSQFTLSNGVEVSKTFVEQQIKE